MSDTHQESDFQLDETEHGYAKDHVMDAAHAVSEIANRTEDGTDDEAKVMAGLVKIAFALRRLGTMLDMNTAELDEAIAVRIGRGD